MLVAVITLSVILADILSKYLVIQLLVPLNRSVTIIPKVLDFTYVENRGMAFGLLADNRWVFMIISVIAIAALMVYLWKFRPDSRFACLALSMIAGGGIGNMIDRVFLGYVVDFIDFCAFPKLWMWVFNVADAFVCVGAGMLIVWLIVSMIREYKLQKQQKAEGAQVDDGMQTASDMETVDAQSAPELQAEENKE